MDRGREGHLAQETIRMAASSGHRAVSTAATASVGHTQPLATTESAEAPGPCLAREARQPCPARSLTGKPGSGWQSGDLAGAGILGCEDCEYDPERPWGTRGIAYDPTSPYWTWKTSTRPPPAVWPISSGRDNNDIFTQLKAVAAIMAQEMESGPKLPSDDQVACSDQILRILRDITDAAPCGDPIAPKLEKTAGDATAVPYRPAAPEAPSGSVVSPRTTKKSRRKSGTTADGEPRPKPIRKSKGQRSPLTAPPAPPVPPAPTVTTPKPPAPPFGSEIPALTLRCCPVEVPSILHMILDRTGDKLDPHMVEQYAGHADKLCAQHLEKFRRLRAAMHLRRITSSRPGTPQSGIASAPTATIASPQITTGPIRGLLPASIVPAASPGRAAALPTPPAEKPVRKKRRTTGDANRLPRVPKAVARSGERPVPNVIRDNQYRRQMLYEIEERFARAEPAEQVLRTHGGVTNQIVHNLLSVARQPNASPERGPVEVHFLTGEEARAMMEAGSPTEPIVTEKEQTFRWQPRLRPIAELFRRMENLDRAVSVQVPSRDCMGDSFESRGLKQVRQRFLGGGSGSTDEATPATNDPWNILDLRSPIPAAVLPQFLTCENCQLLPRLRDEVLSPERAERDTATRSQWNEWRDVLEWVLLSQGGHNTSPHTDSHGLATWITVQEGLFGYGWLSRPTAAERASWMADPHGYTGGQWRYMVLEPGQTVFFNSGTVHFVFRLRSEHTLALGGHILQWTGIEQWLQIVAAQMRNPHITNEDMEWSAPKYVRIVARLVEMRLRNGRVAELGGEAAMRRLLVLLQEFEEAYMKERSLRGRPKKKKRR